MEYRTVEQAPRVSTPESAALALHRPGLSAADVIRLLTELIEQLDLAEDARFLPAERMDLSVVEPMPSADGHHPPTEFPVRPPAADADGESAAPLEGVVRCRPVSAEAHEQIAALAAHAGVALTGVRRLAEIAEREEGVRRVAERLQDSLLPELPELAHTSAAVRYRAAAREARVGGDFYDMFPLPDSRVLIVVGDVVGKGVQAASRTTRITQTLRSLALQGLPLDDLLERVDEQVTFQDPEIMATVWCGIYEPDTGELWFASLGHPPALLLRRGGETVRLELEGLPLGLRDLSDEPPEIRSRRLAPRDLLVLYTDGVVEATGDFVAGQRQLLEAVHRRHSEPLREVIDTVMDELLLETERDDALLLLLRHR